MVENATVRALIYGALGALLLVVLAAFIASMSTMKAEKAEKHRARSVREQELKSQQIHHSDELLVDSKKPTVSVRQPRKQIVKAGSVKKQCEHEAGKMKKQQDHSKNEFEKAKNQLVGVCGASMITIVLRSLKAWMRSS